MIAPEKHKRQFDRWCETNRNFRSGGPPDHTVPGEFLAFGFFGQFLWIDPHRDVVIAVNSGNRGFRQHSPRDNSIATFRAITGMVEASRSPEDAP